VLRALVAGMVIGAMLAVVVLFGAGGRLTILPGISLTGPVVQNGVAVIVSCGKKSSIRRMDGTGYAPEPGTGTWGYRRRGDCTVWYHSPPGAEQRHARRQRARETSH
jgi:hypothetical protein